MSTEHVTESRPNLARFCRHLRDEARKDRSYLVPLRIFIGVGWLRAFAEKAIEPDWHDGTYLSTFLGDHLREGRVALPPYETLITDLFRPHATALGWIVITGQLLAGLAILTGCLTRAALVGGLFMNLQFLLAGEPDPSAFYIVIQTVLLLANAGTILGLDAHLPNRFRPRRPFSSPGWVWLGIAIPLSLSAAVYALVCADHWGPAGSVHDPAMVLAVLAFLTASWSVIALLRGDHMRHEVESAPAQSDPVVAVGLSARQSVTLT
jgi:uncharacterized membrane protein YphA (DoxX/SURF4 family)